MPFDLIAAKPANDTKASVPGFEYYVAPRQTAETPAPRAAETALEQMFGYYS